MARFNSTISDETDSDYAAPTSYGGFNNYTAPTNYVTPAYNASIIPTATPSAVETLAAVANPGYYTSRQEWQGTPEGGDWATVQDWHAGEDPVITALNRNKALGFDPVAMGLQPNVTSASGSVEGGTYDPGGTPTGGWWRPDPTDSNKQEFWDASGNYLGSRVKKSSWVSARDTAIVPLAKMAALAYGVNALGPMLGGEAVGGASGSVLPGIETAAINGLELGTAADAASTLSAANAAALTDAYGSGALQAGAATGGGTALTDAAINGLTLETAAAGTPAISTAPLSTLAATNAGSFSPVASVAASTPAAASNVPGWLNAIAGPGTFLGGEQGMFTGTGGLVGALNGTTGWGGPLLAAGSGLYGMYLANQMRSAAADASQNAAPWTASGGTAAAGEALRRVVAGDFANDPGFNAAQLAAARASAQQPGGFAASAAAQAALRYQNERIAALSAPAGVGFSPAAGYQLGLSGQSAANQLASSSLGAIAFGLSGAGQPMSPLLQKYLIQNGLWGG